MKRLAYSVATAVASWACLAAAQTAPAQTTLDRLEGQIRGQAAAGAESALPGKPRTATDPATKTAGSRPFLGALADDKADRGRGVRILQVHPGGPAERAGLRAQDLITAAAGARVRQMSEFVQILDVYSAGDKLSLEILRNGKAQKVEMTLGVRPDAVQPPAASPPEALPAPPAEVAPPPFAPGPILTPPVPPPPPDVTGAARIEQLQRRIEQLERRVEELERALAETRKSK